MKKINKWKLFWVKEKNAQIYRKFTRVYVYCGFFFPFGYFYFKSFLLVVTVYCLPAFEFTNNLCEWQNLPKRQTIVWQMTNLTQKAKISTRQKAKRQMWEKIIFRKLFVN